MKADHEAPIRIRGRRPEYPSTMKVTPSPRLTVRDRFALSVLSELFKVHGAWDTITREPPTIAETARIAYAMADAMIKERR